jgi:hypothetical protein
LTRIRDAQTTGKTLFPGVSVKRCFWKRLVFKSVVGSKKFVLTNRSEHYSICRGSEQKRKA